MVTDIFQLPQVVGGDDRCQVPLRHIVREQALYRLAHHRIKTVEGLVTENIVRSRADPVDDRELLFHPF